MFSYLIFNYISSLFLGMWSDIDIWMLWKIRLGTYISELCILRELELLNMKNPPKTPLCVINR